jgi:membrane-associated protease RseP (regulator of RpoE activity)
MAGGFVVFIALVLFIVAHEAGHYFAAKATGMKVTEFFLGFGPRIWSFKRGETEYGIKPIPFGAYVKVIGMSSIDEVDPEDEHRTYRSKPFWAKSLVVLSGVAANFLIAYLIFFGLALTQGQPVVVDGQLVETTTIGSVVIEDENGATTTAAELGLEPSDIIVAIDGRPTPEWEDLVAALESRAGDVIDVTVQRGSDELVLSGELGTRVVEGEVRGFLGISPAPLTEQLSVTEAVVDAGSQFVEGVRFTFVSFARLLQFDSLGQLFGGIFGGEVDDEVRPVSLVGVVQIGAQADEVGFATIALILAIINVVLGIINGLPLFPLDGGHFAVALYEKISGRTADVRKLIPVAVVVIAFISIFGLAAIILDLVQPIDL